MIIKSFELNKIKLDDSKIILFYGNNEGFKKEATNLIFRSKTNILTFEEKEILDNPEILFDKVLSKSLFENERFIIIKRVTDKILKTIEEIDTKEITDTTILINSESVEKKSAELVEASKDFL